MTIRHTTGRGAVLAARPSATRACRLAVCAALAAAASSSAFAQGDDHVRELGSLSLSELMQLEVDSVYGASRYVQKASRAPSSVSIVTADDIARFGARTLGDVLANVRGMFVANDRNYLFLGIRGFQRPGDYNTRMLVLVDGHRMNDNIYDIGAIGREGMIDVDLIDRVEVIRGPSSSLYGSSAFLGVINVITKTAASAAGIEASGEAGTFDSYKSRLTLGETFDNGVEWLVSASRYTSDGDRHLYYPEFDERISNFHGARNYGVAENLDRESTDSFFTSVRYNAFTISAFWNDRDKSIPTASFDTFFNDPRAHTDDRRSYVDVKYSRALGDSMRLSARAFYDEYYYAGVYPYNLSDMASAPETALFLDEADGRWAGTEWQLTAQLPERHTVVVGGEYRDSFRERQVGYYDYAPSDYLPYQDSDSDVLALFAQSETQLRANLALTAGIRYDRYSGGGDTVNPRLGLVYNPSATGTLKALYGEAFRAPNPYEANYYIGQWEREPLRPESITTYELVYEKQLANDVRLTVSGYDYTIDDLINQAGASAAEVHFANLEGVTAHGIEIEIDRQFASGLSLRASYAGQRAEDLAGRELTTSPRHLSRLDLRMPLRGDKLQAGLQLQHQSDALTLSGARTGDAVTANFTLRKPVKGKGLELSAAIYNLFDERYAYPGATDHHQESIEQDGRAFHGKLTYRF